MRNFYRPASKQLKTANKRATMAVKKTFEFEEDVLNRNYKSTKRYDAAFCI